MSQKKKPAKSLLGGCDMCRIFFISGKVVFIISAFLFFIAYVAMTSGFYGEAFFPFFLSLYIAFVLSANFFLGASIIHLLHTKLPKTILFPLLIIPGLAIGVFLYPVL